MRYCRSARRRTLRLKPNRAAAIRRRRENRLEGPRAATASGQPSARRSSGPWCRRRHACSSSRSRTASSAARSGASAVAGAEAVTDFGFGLRRKTLAGRREREHLLDVSPVDEMVEPSFEIFRPFVAVVDVIGVLPHVDAKDRPAALDKRVLTVWRLGHLELAILDGKPRPA